MALDLYLIRHAIADERDPLRWPDDGERPLTKDGIKKFQRGAAGLAGLVPSVDIVLSSPFVRAWQTATILHDVAGWPPPVGFETLLPDTPPQAVVDALREHAERPSIALVGHEPSLSYLASYLLAGTEAELQLVMKKGGAASLRFVGPVDASMGQLQWWATPKMLRALAR